MKIKEKNFVVELTGEEVKNLVEELSDLEDPKNPTLEKESPALWKLLRLLKGEPEQPAKV